MGDGPKWGVFLGQRQGVSGWNFQLQQAHARGLGGRPIVGANFACNAFVIVFGVVVVVVVVFVVLVVVVVVQACLPLFCRFFISPTCAITVLHVRPTHPQTNIVGMVGTNDLSARFEDIYPQLHSDLQVPCCRWSCKYISTGTRPSCDWVCRIRSVASQEGLKHHLPNSARNRDDRKLQLHWFRVAFELEGVTRLMCPDEAGMSLGCVAR